MDSYLGVFIGHLVPSPAACRHLLDHQCPGQQEQTETHENNDTRRGAAGVAGCGWPLPPLPLVEQQAQQTGHQHRQQDAEDRPHGLAPPREAERRVHVLGGRLRPVGRAAHRRGRKGFRRRRWEPHTAGGLTSPSTINMPLVGF